MIMKRLIFSICAVAVFVPAVASADELLIDTADVKIVEAEAVVAPTIDTLAVACVDVTAVETVAAESPIPSVKGAQESMVGVFSTCLGWLADVVACLYEGIEALRADLNGYNVEALDGHIADAYESANTTYGTVAHELETTDFKGTATDYLLSGVYYVAHYSMLFCEMVEEQLLVVKCWVEESRQQSSLAPMQECVSSQTI